MSCRKIFNERLLGFLNIILEKCRSSNFPIFFTLFCASLSYREIMAANLLVLRFLAVTALVTVALYPTIAKKI